MSYNSNIPLITDPILQSAQQIRANFQAINSTFANNHAGLTEDPSISGMHNVLILRPQMADPATSSTQTALYNKLVSSIPELFFRPNNSQTPIQMTYPSIKADSSNTQYSFVAGPFIVYGGFISAPTNGQLVTLSPGTTLLYVDMTVANSTISPTVQAEAIPTNITGTSFNITYQNTGGFGSFDVYYFAIGV
jgi:hypothetical protein